MIRNATALQTSQQAIPSSTSDNSIILFIVPSIIRLRIAPHAVTSALLQRESANLHAAWRNAISIIAMHIECTRSTEQLMTLAAVGRFLPVPPAWTASTPVDELALLLLYSRKGYRFPDSPNHVLAHRKPAVCSFSIRFTISIVVSRL